MKARVIPNAVRDLSMADGSHQLRCVMVACVGEVPRSARDDCVVCVVVFAKAAAA